MFLLLNCLPIKIDLCFYKICKYFCIIKGGKVKNIGVDPCAKEPCTVGFCYNDVFSTYDYTIVTDENGVVPPLASARTFISMEVHDMAVCVSEIRKVNTD